METNWKQIREDIISLNTKPQENSNNMENKLTKLHYHEALDRTFLAGKFVEDMLSEHPVYKQNPELNKKLDNVLEILADLYQEIPNLPKYS